MLKWENWVRGMVAAFIGGGASAVTAGISASMIDPSKFNLNDQLGNFFKMMGTTFVINGILSMFFYLKQSPVPADDTVVSTSHAVVTTDAVTISKQPPQPPTVGQDATKPA